MKSVKLVLNIAKDLDEQIGAFGLSTDFRIENETSKLVGDIYVEGGNLCFVNKAICEAELAFTPFASKLGMDLELRLFRGQRPIRQGQGPLPVRTSLMSEKKQWIYRTMRSVGAAEAMNKKMNDLSAQGFQFLGSGAIFMVMGKEVIVKAKPVKTPPPPPPVDDDDDDDDGEGNGLH